MQEHQKRLRPFLVFLKSFFYWFKPKIMIRVTHLSISQIVIFPWYIPIIISPITAKNRIFQNVIKF